MRIKALRKPLILAVLAAGCLAQQQKESLLIGPGDLLRIQVFDTPEMDQRPRVTDGGSVPVLFVGEVHVAGATPSAAARLIEEALKARKYMLHPQVTVTVEEYATQQVFVMGQVRTPGSFPISTPMSVVNVLSLAGGLTDLADRHITIQRRSDPTQKLSYFLSNQADEALDKQEVVYPGDTLLVPRVGIVYVLGDVGRPGGYPMSTNSSQMTLLQALALAGAANRTSVVSRARLIRKTANGPREVPIAIAAIQKGKQPDVPMQADDVLFVPFSFMKNVALNGTQIASSAATAMIYTLP